MSAAPNGPLSSTTRGFHGPPAASREAPFHDLVEQATDLIFLTDAQGRFTYANEAAERLLGMPRAQIVGRPFLLLIEPTWRAEAAAFYARQVREGLERTYYEFPVRTRREEIRWVGQHAHLVLEAGQVAGVQGVARDITAWKQAQADAQSREARMRLLYQIVSQRALSIERQIDQALTMTTDLLGLDIGILSRIEGDTYTVVQCHAPEAPLAPGDTFETGTTYCSLTLQADGVFALDRMGASPFERHPCYERFGLESYIGIPLVVRGEPYGTLNFSSVAPVPHGFSDADRDLMRLMGQWVEAALERGEAKAALRESEERFRVLSQATHEGIFLSHDGLILDANPQGVALFGYDEPSEMIGRPVTDFAHIDSQGLVHTMNTSGNPGAYAALGLRRDGSTFRAEVQGSALPYGDTQVRVTTVRDVTAQHDAERHVRESVSRLSALIQNQQAAVLVEDQDRRIALVNQRFCDLFELPGPPEALVGTSSAEMLRQAAARFGAPEAMLARTDGLRAACEVVTGEELRLADGRLLERDYIPIRSGASCESHMWQYWDVTERRAEQVQLREREATLRAFYDSAPQMMGITELHGDDIYHVSINEATAQFLGSTVEDMSGQYARALGVPEPMIEIWRAAYTVSEQSGRPHHFEYDHDGRRVQVAVNFVDYTARGDARFSFVAEDVSTQREAEARLLFQADVLQQVNDAVFALDGALRVTFWNHAAERLSGAGEAEMLGQAVERGVDFRWARPGARREALLALRRRGAWTGEVAVVPPGGTERWGEVTLSLLRDDRRAVQGVLAVVRDVTERKEMEQRLVRQAREDALTGLPNRIVLMERLQKAVQRCQRRGRRFALLFLDIDHFKVVNDSLGHFAGDALLVELARRVQSCLAPADLLARLGGDEFAILLEGVHEPEEAEAVALRIKEVLYAPFDLDGRVHRATASVGVVFGGEQYRQTEEVLRDSDTAMYHAKQAGRATHALFDPTMHAQASKRFELEAEMRVAVERKQLRTFYQPIVDLHSGQVIGFEALLRWQHPRLGLLTPHAFLDIAYETGHIVDFDFWVMEQACRQTKRWQDRYGGAFRTANVNCSSDTFLQPAFAQRVADIVEAAGLDPSSLAIEITEHMLIGDLERARHELDQLRAYGIQLCLDDFGTGYSSLSLLHTLPINTLKIDRSFLAAGGSSKGSSIVETIASMARGMALSVVVEGIETPGQLAQVQALGCEYGQGYLFSRPTKARQAEELLAHPSLTDLFAGSGATPGDR